MLTFDFMFSGFYETVIITGFIAVNSFIKHIISFQADIILFKSITSQGKKRRENDYFVITSVCSGDFYDKYYLMTD